MSIEIISKAAQVNADVNEEEILMNKPIGFPNDHGEQHPYSNIFYFMNAESEEGSTLPLHRHEGFEILTFVNRGWYEYYDSTIKKWIRLHGGDVNLVKAGKGIAHAEKLGTNSQILQIWFNPDLIQTLKKEPFVADFKNSDFYSMEMGNKKIKSIIGNDELITLDSDDITIKEITFFHGTHIVALEQYSCYSIYLIKGDLELNTLIVTQDDFIIVKDESELEITCGRESKILLIESPMNLKYKTYYNYFQDKYS